MENGLNLRIFTKNKKILDETVEAVFIPALTGEIGVLPGHRPLVASLGIGILRYLKDGKEYFLGVDEGLVEVLDNNITILLDRIIEKEKVKEEEELAKISEAEESLKYLSGIEQEEAKKKIKRAETSLKLLKH